MLKLIDIFPFAVIDVYNMKSKPFLAAVKNIRFFFSRDAIGLARKKYDIVVDYLSPGKVTSGLADLNINNFKKSAVRKFADGFEEIKKEYSYCFSFKNQYLFQKKAVKNGLKINDVIKLSVGIKDIKKII